MRLIRKNRDLILHLLMAFMGGSSAIYGILVRGSFGQAVTSNLANVLRHLLLGEDPIDALFRFLGILTFLLALAVAHILQYRSQLLAEKVCFLSQLVCIFTAAAIPSSVKGILALLPIFFMTGIQWGTFTGAAGFNSATIFCSNNSKQALYGWLDYLFTKKKDDLAKGLFYTATVCSFYLAVVIFLFLSERLGTRAILAELIPLALASLVWAVR